MFYSKYFYFVLLALFMLLIGVVGPKLISDNQAPVENPDNKTTSGFLEGMVEMRKEVVSTEPNGPSQAKPR